MVLGPRLVGGYVFESHCISISPIYYVSPKEANCGCLHMGLFIYLCVGMRLHIREGVGVHDIHCGP